jgi:hypothetical protein
MNATFSIVAFTESDKLLIVINEVISEKQASKSKLFILDMNFIPLLYMVGKA